LRKTAVRPVPGYEARIVGDDMRDLQDGEIGRLAVRGPTGCRYLDDLKLQKTYVVNGWNLTGDAFLRDDDGYFWYQARTDDMIITSGYNVAAPEVEAVLLEHPAVSECAVIGIAEIHSMPVSTAPAVLPFKPPSPMGFGSRTNWTASVRSRRYPNSVHC
jgi:2-aminobenzoate-CoA ligase